MFTRPSTSQRLQVGLILAMAFLLVLGSNRLDQRHFSTIQTTVNSVYKDRVVVQDYIYQLSSIFHNKKVELITKNSPDTAGNEQIAQLLNDFRNTELTLEEQDRLNKLSGQFEKLRDLENRIMNPKTNIDADLGVVASKTLDEIELSLDALAQIQLDESGQLTSVSNKALGMNILLSKLEVAFLIIIGLAMLALIFYPASEVRAATKDL